MRQYTVVFLPIAEQELASIWENADDRSRVTHAADLAEGILRSEPTSQAVFLSEDLWRVEVDPLRFYFGIREEDRIVEVSNVIPIDG